MSGQQVIIVRTGSANLASVAAAIERLGSAVRLTEDPAVVREAPAVVLPGVGAFGPAMARLRERGIDDAVRERVRRGGPLLAICLGMQLLSDASDESRGIAGLGIVPGRFERFAGPLRVPQMGWNRITATPGATLLRSAAMYFANSYRLPALPQDWEGATATYGGPFVAAIEQGALLACQFHPELSGRDGLSLLGRWLALVQSQEAAPC